MMDKWLCEECGERVFDNQILVADNPFDKSVTVAGCPGCKEVNTLIRACDFKDCWGRVVQGAPTDHGYKNTCSRHKPNDA